MLAMRSTAVFRYYDKCYRRHAKHPLHAFLTHPHGCLAARACPAGAAAAGGAALGKPGAGPGVCRAYAPLESVCLCHGGHAAGDGGTRPVRHHAGAGHLDSYRHAPRYARLAWRGISQSVCGRCARSGPASPLHLVRRQPPDAGADRGAGTSRRAAGRCCLPAHAVRHAARPVAAPAAAAAPPALAAQPTPAPDVRGAIRPPRRPAQPARLGAGAGHVRPHPGPALCAGNGHLLAAVAPAAAPAAGAGMAEHAAQRDQHRHRPGLCRHLGL